MAGCEQCDDTGLLEVAIGGDPDRCRQVACSCEAGEARLEEGERRRDDAYERAAARARDNDFADTNGVDWT
jgi:hypothetical protein